MSVIEIGSRELFVNDIYRIISFLVGIHSTMSREMTDSEITIAALQAKVNEQADALDELAMVVAEREG